MPDELLGYAEKIIRLRSERERFFPGALFSDPAWDLILVLFVARERGNKVQRSNLIPTIASSELALDRWLKILAGRGIVTVHGGACSEISLTEIARRSVCSLLATAEQGETHAARTSDALHV